MLHTPPTDMPPISNALYIVATPIGNLWDITYRAVAVLSAVDIIFCEDTRTSAKLLSAFGISTKTLSYHDHNGKQQRPKILDMLNKGKSIALISDAGTPLINDPRLQIDRYDNHTGAYGYPNTGGISPPYRPYGGGHAIGYIYLHRVFA